LRSTAYTEERRQFDWIVDLLIKLAKEEDAYDACALVVPEWQGAAPVDTGGNAGMDDVIIEPDDVDVEDVDEEAKAQTDAELDKLPTVHLRHDLVPDEISPARFFRVILNIVLDNSGVTQHEEARAQRAGKSPPSLP
jgi:hypothetical protein